MFPLFSTLHWSINKYLWLAVSLNSVIVLTAAMMGDGVGSDIDTQLLSQFSADTAVVWLLLILKYGPTAAQQSRTQHNSTSLCVVLPLCCITTAQHWGNPPYDQHINRGQTNSEIQQRSGFNEMEKEEDFQVLTIFSITASSSSSKLCGIAPW